MRYTFARLTTRELEVLNLIAQGNSSKEIARRLGIAFKTACCHRAHVLGKMGAHKAMEAVANAAAQGLIDYPRRTEPEADRAALCGTARGDTARTSFRDNWRKLSVALHEHCALLQRVGETRQDLKAVQVETRALLTELTARISDRSSN
jgi:DNA-binding CsgD family transcriptional regulator